MTASSYGNCSSCEHDPHPNLTDSHRCPSIASLLAINDEESVLGKYLDLDLYDMDPARYFLSYSFGARTFCSWTAAEDSENALHS